MKNSKNRFNDAKNGSCIDDIVPVNMRKEIYIRY